MLINVMLINKKTCMWSEIITRTFAQSISEITVLISASSRKTSWSICFYQSKPIRAM